jgi:two-component system, OmpR family, sensor histidine kinase KdpD
MTNDTPARPDPDDLLRRVLADEARARRGRLKIFFGACAGVGKTCAMLSAAKEAQRAGVPLTVGVVETHGRAETEALAAGLPHLGLRSWAYRDRQLSEFDLDAALRFGADHSGGLVLIDELAHSNVTGSRHPKRWQDVEELRDAGVDVWTTMNVQHLESLNDIVRGITGVPVWETVPDTVFDQADEVLVVDLPPDELLDRLRAGKVYVPQQAERAAANFFRKGNLLALRELALRRTADRVDGQMQDYRRRTSVQMVWPNREALLACVGQGAQGEKVVRSCARMATQLGVPWHAVHVETPSQEQRPEVQRRQSEQVLQLAESLGAGTVTLSAPDVAAALVRYAREHNLVRLVMGRSVRRWWRWHTLADQIAGLAQDLDVLQVAVPQERVSRQAAAVDARQGGSQAGDGRTIWRGYAWAMVACGATALLATPLVTVLELTNIVMLFLLAVVGVGLRHGRGPAVMAAFVGVGLFDYFFVQPRFSFAVSDVQYLVTFSVMLVVALVVGQLTAGLKVQAEAARQREHRVRRLYEMSRDLSAALLTSQVSEIGTRFVAAELDAQCGLLLADDDGHLQTPQIAGAQAIDMDMAVAQWALDREQAAGRGTDTLPSSACLMLPLKAPMRTRGVLGLRLPEGRALNLEQRRLLETCASLLAISLERIHYVEVAQASTLQIESERLRNSLLSAISHDLRTPLASLLGLSETLAVSLNSRGELRVQRELVEAIHQSAQRMSALVNNLLDMARLEAGSVQLRRDWVPLDEVVGSALRVAASQVREHGVTVILAPDLPLLDIDAVLFERVLVNLLENAAKYAPGPGAWILRAWRDDDEVVISMEDHGPGLPAGRETAIFEKFERGHKESATPGVGLGLAICRAIVQAHGGTIRGETRRDGEKVLGARFILRLPAGMPPQDDGSHAWMGAAQEPAR